MDYSFRRVNDNDQEVVISIYNYFVENSFAAYPEKKVAYDFFEKLKEMAKGYPFYVIETEDKEVIGFGLLQRYHSMDVFKRVAKVMYFILPLHTRKGLGKKLLNILVEEAKEMGIDTLLANISSMNEISLSFHDKNGFKQCGRFRRIGKKFRKDFDEIWVQRSI
ncbi:MAG: N-acetyltransferase family protein [Candidatus Bathyarchaeum sp.]|nr:MAG: N-acetyltransferase family protein [Candidatus Bathyarchaeum sp.]